MSGDALSDQIILSRKNMHFFWLDSHYFTYLLYITPALILGLWAQLRISTTYAAAQRQPAPLSGAAAARHILDSAGLQDVGIEEIPGHLSDHYDPSQRVLRLSSDIYRGQTLAAVGIAAHESGHALQHAQQYPLMAIRNAAVPAAGFGSGAGMTLAMLGIIFSLPALLLVGIVIFAGMVFFQVVNLPVEFDASHRAKVQLVQLGIVPPEEMYYVNRVLNAAALTYVAATLQSILTLLYYLSMLSNNSRRN
jgi:Zn-dependent membrane protease YugP